MIRTSLLPFLLSSAVFMAPPDDDKPGQIGNGLTTSVDLGGQSGFAGSISMDITGDDVRVSDEGQQTDHIEVGDGADATQQAKPEDNTTAADDEAAGDGAGTEDDDGTTAEDTSDDADLPELPEFKADDPETIKAYDGVFKTDGKLRMDALSKQWWANAQAAENGVGHLDEGTYAYLDSLGIPKELVQQAEAGQQAINTQANQAIYARAGGKANLDLALKWGGPKEKGGLGGYTEEQRIAFNEALAAGGVKAAEAVDLLMSRYTKASSVRTSPNKTAADGGHGPGAGGEGAGGDVFKSRDEWLAARKEAGGNMSKQAQVSAKFRRSPGALSW